MSAQVRRPALRYHGGKFRLASWILGHFPEHRAYVEPFGGGAGVLLQKPRSFAEIYNDLDEDIVNFFRVLRDPELRDQLIVAVTLTPYSRMEFELAWQPTEDLIERARRTAVRAQMGFTPAATRSQTGFRVDTRRHHAGSNQPNQGTWTRYPDSIAAAGQRLTGVIIENRPAIDVILNHDSAETLFYVDPPYVHSTRDRRNLEHYRHEMTEADHAHLIAALQNVRGMVLLSGYHNDLYASHLEGWESKSTTARINGGKIGGALRTEHLWINPACAARLR